MAQYINSAVTIMKKCENYELKRIDAEIAELEARIAFKQEQRREIINRKDLNKLEHICSEHEWTEASNVTSDGYHWLCVICKKRTPADSVIRKIDKHGIFMKEINQKDLNNNERSDRSSNSPIASEWSAR